MCTFKQPIYKNYKRPRTLGSQVLFITCIKYWVFPFHLTCEYLLNSSVEAPHDATGLTEPQRGERLHAMSLRLSVNCERLGREDKLSANKRCQHKQSQTHVCHHNTSQCLCWQSKLLLETFVKKSGIFWITLHMNYHGWYSDKLRKCRSDFAFIKWFN